MGDDMVYSIRKRVEGLRTRQLRNTKQNIPRGGALGKKIRHAFCAPPGFLLIVADYSQLEVRLFAHFSEDERMVQAICEGQDLHCRSAALMFGCTYEDVLIAKLKDDKAAEKLLKMGITLEMDEEGHPVLTEQERDLLAQRQAAKTLGFG